MDPFRICLSILPLAIYLLILGIINLSRRSLLTNGARELTALGVALSGFLIIGPIELFMPRLSLALLGPRIWIFLAALYVLTVTLLVLVSKPRLVVYNTTLDQLRPLVGDLVAKLDPDHRWAGDCVVLPRLGIQLQLEKFALMRNCTLLATSNDQNLGGWRLFEVELRRELSRVKVSPNPIAFPLLMTSLVFLATVLVNLCRDPQAVAQGLRELLRL